MEVIKIENLSRTYKSYIKPEGLKNSLKAFFNRQYVNKDALKPLNLTINQGEIVGLVGANGAGKTTLLKLLSGLIFPTTGTAKVLGFTPWERESIYLKKIAILLGQKNQLWWDISANDSYSLLSKIYELDSQVAKKRIMELSEMLSCKHVLDIQLRRLSLGERMKMEIIGAFLHDPEIVFLDEPTIGLDIVSQDAVRSFLESYVPQKKKTVILTSHYMDDISLLADRLLLMSQGKIVYDGDIDSFVKSSVDQKEITVEFLEPIGEDATILNKLEVLKGSRLVRGNFAKRDLSQALEELAKLGIISDVKIEEKDFEEVIKGFLEKESRAY